MLHGHEAQAAVEDLLGFVRIEVIRRRIRLAADVTDGKDETCVLELPDGLLAKLHIAVEAMRAVGRRCYLSGKHPSLLEVPSPRYSPKLGLIPANRFPSFGTPAWRLGHSRRCNGPRRR